LLQLLYFIYDQSRIEENYLLLDAGCQEIETSANTGLLEMIVGVLTTVTHNTFEIIYFLFI